MPITLEDQIRLDTAVASLERKIKGVRGEMEGIQRYIDCANRISRDSPKNDFGVLFTDAEILEYVNHVVSGAGTETE